MNKKLIIYIGVFSGDWIWAENVLKKFKTLYPTAILCSISDGAILPKYRKICEDLNVIYYEDTNRLKKLYKQPYLFLERYFNFIEQVSNGDDYILMKTDPDSLIIKEYPNLFSEDYDIICSNDGRFEKFKGAFYILTKDSVTKILNSGYLRNKVYQNNDQFCVGKYQSSYNLKFDEKDYKPEYLISEALILSSVVNKLNLNKKQLQDCLLTSSRPDITVDQINNYNLIHPNPFLY